MSKTTEEIKNEQGLNRFSREVKQHRVEVKFSENEVRHINIERHNENGNASRNSETGARDVLWQKV